MSRKNKAKGHNSIIIYITYIKDFSFWIGVMSLNEFGGKEMEHGLGERAPPPQNFVLILWNFNIFTLLRNIFEARIFGGEIRF